MPLPGLRQSHRRRDLPGRRGGGAGEGYRPVDDGALGTPPLILDAQSKPENGGFPIAPRVPVQKA